MEQIKKDLEIAVKALTEIQDYGYERGNPERRDIYLLATAALEEIQTMVIE